MFNVDTTTFTITMSRGDTGKVTFQASGCNFESQDRALFTVKNSAGDTIIEELYELDENGAFTVDFRNEDTDSLPTGTYTYDVRYVFNPVYDENDVLINGYPVRTPKRPMNLVLVATVGQV